MAPALLSQRPKILFLDAYDSFSNNIVALVEQNVDADVVKVFIDEPSLLGGDNPNDHFLEYLQQFDAVIAGPGPGWPKCAKDVGLMKELWELQDDSLIPVLGICLGFQSLCLAFGADVQRLNTPRHGIITSIKHSSRSIFQNVTGMTATQYHSLQVKLDHSIQTTRSVRYPAQLWEATENCPSLEPLAWDFDCDENGAVLMGVKHAQKPFWGVQFHPESICTDQEGSRMIRNWWEEAQAWRFERTAKRTTAALPKSLDASSGVNITGPEFRLGQQRSSRTALVATPESNTFTPKILASLFTNGDGKSPREPSSKVVFCATTGSGRLTVADVCETLDIPRQETIVLQSGLQSNLLPMAVGTGRYSIVGLIIPGETLRLHYYTGTRKMELRDGADRVRVEWTTSDPWSYIEEVMTSLRPTQPPTTSTWAPFWGGLMGYASYEAGLETINVPVDANNTYPDICFAYITRSVVFDHQVKKIYVQSIRGPNDNEWVHDTLEKIYDAAGLKSLETSPSATPMPKPNPFEQPAPMTQYIDSCVQVWDGSGRYCDKVRSCQEAIADGQSYELCLTTRNQIRARRPTACRISQAENNEHSWNMYKRLTGQNPAPFSAYMRVHNVHVLSSSPERYISWDRTQTSQCRPIKGTVQKKPGVTAEAAHVVLSSSKERAENLMIVDLTRHQLHGVYGSENVHVSQLMEVEEYETLWQLVSVIDAGPRDSCKPKAPEGWEESAEYRFASKTKPIPYLGFEAFVASLPPGSMTGAPKKRSCEILQKEEGVRRGIYSGVLGYLDVGGGGDFSVVIRTAVKIDDPRNDQDDLWQIGAGGAVTSQSTPEGEYEEMLAKFSSTARAFQHPPPGTAPASKRRGTTGRGQANLRELLDSNWTPDGMSLDDAQLMLRAVEEELRRRTAGTAGDFEIIEQNE